MSGTHDYALPDYPTSTGHRTISYRSRVSNDSYEQVPSQNPFADQPENPTENLSSQPYDPAAGNYLLSNGAGQQQAQKQSLFGEWIWELVTWLIATVSLGILVIVFLVYHDKPLRQWKAGITPATTVAILSQVGQTSILAPVTACICQSMWLFLEKASQSNTRGHQPKLITMQTYDDASRGPLSSLLLLWRRPNALLVWLGTVNTLLIIIFGSFAQQALQLPIREFNVTDEGDSTITRALQYRAPRPAVSQLIPDSEILFSYETAADLMSVAIMDGLLSKRRTEFHEPGCNYSVPAINQAPTARGTVLETYLLGETFWMGASRPRNLPSGEAESTFPPGYKPNTLVDFYVIYEPDLATWDNLNIAENNKDELVALKGTLSLCVNKYRTSMTFGVTTTDLLSTETDLDWRKGNETSDGTTFDTVTATHNGETFWMADFNQRGIYNYLSIEALAGTASMRSAASTPDGGGNYSENTIVAAIFQSLDYDHAGLSGLSKKLDTLAVSMSNALRTSTDVPDVVKGTSSSFQVYIEIEWTWMIVPIITVILSLVFLLLTIYSSRQSRIPAWKSSLLAVLFGLGSDTRSGLGVLGPPKEMEAKAKDKNVRLESAGGQWQIVKAD
ncbi:MAG: hypothetical protein Q9168_007445 [Polycauliona sp. 1 TL-2023]